jgi:very-short-patch-repair endonuclease
MPFYGKNIQKEETYERDAVVPATHNLQDFQKILRSSQTDAERLLWYHLRQRRLQGFKFRRQHILQGYIVDFVCLQRKLIIEADGGQHADQKDYDDRRTQVFEKQGFDVLRFWNNEILTNIEGVLEVILQHLILI